MTQEEEKSLHTFEASVRQLILQYRLLQEKNLELQIVLEEKDAQIASRGKQIEELKKSYADLKLAKMMEIGNDDLKDAKQKLSRLIREVDKCIALLNV